MPGTTPIQDSRNSNLVTNVDSVDCSKLISDTNNKRDSLSSTCSSLSIEVTPVRKANWSPVKREVSHCGFEPSTPHPLHSDAAVKPHRSLTNSLNQVWVAGPPTPPTGDISPNALAINLIQSLAEGKVIIEGNQVTHVKGVINPIAIPKPTAQGISENELTSETKRENQDDQIYGMIDNNGKEECKIVHVEEGDESIKDMLDKQINYGEKMKYTDGRANRSKKLKPIHEPSSDMETEKK